MPRKIPNWIFRGLRQGFDWRPLSRHRKWLNLENKDQLDTIKGMWNAIFKVSDSFRSLSGNSTKYHTPCLSKSFMVTSHKREQEVLIQNFWTSQECRIEILNSNYWINNSLTGLNAFGKIRALNQSPWVRGKIWINKVDYEKMKSNHKKLQELAFIFHEMFEKLITKWFWL